MTDAMTEKGRLIHTLFETNGREHLNIKFFRGSSDNISPETLAREANSGIFQADLGLAEEEPGFGDRNRTVIDIANL